MSTTKTAACPAVKRSWADVLKGSAPATCSENVDADTMPNRQSEGGASESLQPECACTDSVDVDTTHNSPSEGGGASEPQPSTCVQPPAWKTFKPGKPGARTCLCYGRLLVMLEYYGWIEARGIIDHPDAQKNGGRIYARRRDFAGEVKEGQIICFYLYVDERGLGAECCQAALACDLKKIMKIGPYSADLKEFAMAAFQLQEPTRAAPPGFNVHAPVFAPQVSAYSQPEYASEICYADAEDTTSDPFPSASFNAEAPEFVPRSFEQSCSIHAPAVKPMQTGYGEAMCAHIANFFCDSSDDESVDELNSPGSLGTKSARAHSSNKSTSAGDLSDSDSNDGEDNVKSAAGYRPPPGLCLPKSPTRVSLPAGFSVPPGLPPPLWGGICTAT